MLATLLEMDILFLLTALLLNCSFTYSDEDGCRNVREILDILAQRSPDFLPPGLVIM